MQMECWSLCIPWLLQSSRLWENGWASWDSLIHCSSTCGNKLVSLTNKERILKLNVEWKICFIWVLAILYSNYICVSQAYKPSLKSMFFHSTYSQCHVWNCKPRRALDKAPLRWFVMVVFGRFSFKDVCFLFIDNVCLLYSKILIYFYHETSAWLSKYKNVLGRYTLEC